MLGFREIKAEVLDYLQTKKFEELEASHAQRQEGVTCPCCIEIISMGETAVPCLREILGTSGYSEEIRSKACFSLGALVSSDLWRQITQPAHCSTIKPTEVMKDLVAVIKNGGANRVSRAAAQAILQIIASVERKESMNNSFSGRISLEDPFGPLRRFAEAALQ